VTQFTNIVSYCGETKTFSEVSSPVAKQGYLDRLDVVRGAAILGVLLFHCLNATWGPERSFPYWNGVRKITFDLTSGTAFWLYPCFLGFLGVAMFFSLSGFCIHYSASRSKSASRWREFLIRRAFRIVPAYFLVALVLAACEMRWSSLLGPPKGLLMHLLFLHNFSKTHFYGINPSFWSIAIEAQLYLLYPVLCIWAMRIGWLRILILTCAIEVTLRLSSSIAETRFGVELPRFVTGSPFSCWFSWTVGAYSAELYLNRRQLPKALEVGCLLILLGCVADIWKVSSTMSFPLVAAGTASFLLSGFCPPDRWKRIPVALGLCSYSLYLIHQPLLFLVGSSLRRNGDLPGLVRLLYVAGTAVLIVPVAWMLFRYLERPSIQAGHRVNSHLIRSSKSKSLRAST
jgi:peptidoglycan/LPS O-acetylase OafA/YrhL